MIKLELNSQDRKISMEDLKESEKKIEMLGPMLVLITAERSTLTKLGHYLPVLPAANALCSTYGIPFEEDKEVEPGVIKLHFSNKLIKRYKLW